MYISDRKQYFFEIEGFLERAVRAIKFALIVLGVLISGIALFAITPTGGIAAALIFIALAVVSLMAVWWVVKTATGHDPEGYEDRDG